MAQIVSTVGYGDFTPTSWYSQLFMSFYCVLHGFFFYPCCGPSQAGRPKLGESVYFQNFLDSVKKISGNFAKIGKRNGWAGRQAEK